MSSATPRPRLGEGALTLDPERSVFINCPFDAEYSPLLEGVIFAIACCAFTPRSAIERPDVSGPRLDRVTRAIFTSRYSIHDLSRCTGEGADNLARFNMPLELGIAIARRFMDQEHDWLALAPEGRPHQRFASDLAGYDILAHDGSVVGVVRRVVEWLSTKPGSGSTATPRRVLAALPRFHEEKSRLEQDWHGEAPWADLIWAAITVARSEVLL